MKLKQFEVFLAVAESGSFSRGAEASFLTQSTVSQHISALEHEFGTRLFDRTGKGALLTEGGKVLAAQARLVLKSAREAEAAMSRFKGVEDVLLVVGGSNIPSNYMIPSALPRLMDKFSSLRINLCQGDSRDILEKLVAEEIEVCVVGSIFSEDGITYSALCQDEIKLVVPQGHRWAGGNPVTVDELIAEPVIVREGGSGTGKAINSALISAGVDPQRLAVKAFLGSNEAVKRAVSQGVGAAFLPVISIKSELERGELVVVPVTGVEIRRCFYLASRAGRELSPAAAGFFGVLRSMYGEPPAVPPLGKE